MWGGTWKLETVTPVGTTLLPGVIRGGKKVDETEEKKSPAEKGERETQSESKAKDGSRGYEITGD